MRILSFSLLVLLSGMASFAAPPAESESDSSKVVIKLGHIDNRLVIKLNGNVVFDKYYDCNPDVNLDIDITDKLESYPKKNEIEFLGYNGASQGGPNPFTFEYTITKGEKVLEKIRVASDDESSSEGLKLDNTHEIALEEDESASDSKSCPDKVETEQHPKSSMDDDND